ncbi:MAG: 3-hydroxyacyl-ACP dehydratase FabZ [Turicibacter sp.]|nr:3-hydroxyacyl-ACP dehydratase FabZ [Turicibacter sp.]
MIERNEIMKLLPHRPPMLLIDCGELKEGVSICYYTVRGNEFFLQGHFPDNPVVPGVIQCEMMAQASCLLFARNEQSIDNPKTPYLTGLDKVKFRSKIVPGNRIELRSELTKQKAPFYFTKCSASVDGKLACTAEISFALI